MGNAEKNINIKIAANAKNMVNQSYLQYQGVLPKLDHRLYIWEQFLL